jgi:pimeloyl-ACP methyl ester carboxylesterase
MSSISFQERGTGKSVILLHGFPMNQHIWDDFAGALSEEYRVYTPDLPGFGKSEILPSPFSLNSVADTLIQWIVENAVYHSVIIGHSLGGYVALAMVEKKQEIFAGFGLFHSTAYPDNAEKKESRTKVLTFVDDNGVEAFTSNFVQPLFADPHHEAVTLVKNISIQSTTDAVKGYTVAMRDRPDRTSVLKEYTRPVLFIAGEKDPAIPVESIAQQASLCNLAQLKVLKNAGHMGMLEQPRETLTALKTFLKQIYGGGG